MHWCWNLLRVIFLLCKYIVYGVCERFVNINNACLKKAEILYDIYKIRSPQKDVKINLVLQVEKRNGEEWGHAWLTVDGKSVCKKNKLKFEIEQIGSNGKYIYWMTTVI